MDLAGSNPEVVRIVVVGIHRHSSCCCLVSLRSGALPLSLPFWIENRVDIAIGSGR